MKSIYRLLRGVGLSLAISGCVVSSNPKITKIDPPMGPTYGGYEIVILGKDFDNEPTVFLGNKILKIKKVEHFSRITADIPRGTEGKLTVVVQNGDNSQAFANDGFEYMKFPYIQTVVPTKGPTAGGTWIKITGEQFDTNAKVYFGKNVAEKSKISSNQVMVIAPPGRQGLVKVSVTNPNGNSHVFRDYFTYE